MFTILIHSNEILLAGVYHYDGNLVSWFTFTAGSVTWQRHTPVSDEPINLWSFLVQLHKTLVRMSWSLFFVRHIASWSQGVSPWRSPPVVFSVSQDLTWNYLPDAESKSSDCSMQRSITRKEKKRNRHSVLLVDWGSAWLTSNCVLVVSMSSCEKRRSVVVCQ